MKLFDSHCHLDDAVFDPDRPQVLARMASAGVRRALVVGVNGDSSRRAADLAAVTSGLAAAVGFHPHDVRHCTSESLATLVDTAAAPHVVAWGEIGLDFNRMYSPRGQQEQWFLRQLDTADGLGLPLVLHERDSAGRLLEILSAHGGPYRGVVHCFSGTAAEMESYLTLGLHIGVTGIVTLQARGRKLRQIVPAIPDERLLVETDAPYLTPAPEKNRTRRNEPAFVRSVLLKLAQVRNQTAEALAERVWANTCGLFGLDPK